ncbi:MAG TPA: hypothetical protein VFN18_09355 [Solirubrobacterales bacterium]|nr:hypothetical protein [Solirubrobacterales bacterium]
MTSPKTLVAIAVVLLAAALAAPSSASANALCSGAPELKGSVLACPAGTLFEKAESVGVSEGSVTFATAVGNFECPSGSFKATYTPVGAGVVAGFATITHDPVCKTTIFGCTTFPPQITTLVKPETEVIYVKTTDPVGNVVVTTPATEVLFKCGGNQYQCIYAGAPGELVTGNYSNSEQKLSFNTTVNRFAGPANCPAKATFVANYKMKVEKGVVGGKAVGESPFYIAKE